jgi:hypothetical protein
MDLKSLDRRERRKTVAAWILIPIVTIVFIMLWTYDEEHDIEPQQYIEQCLEVLENRHEYTSAQVDECRNVILNILRSDGIFGQTHS